LGTNFFARFFRGLRDEVERVPHPERLERRTRAFTRMGLMISDGALRSARRKEADDRARVLVLFDDVDVLIMPVMGGTAIPVRRWEGQGALRTIDGMGRFYPFCAPWNHLGCPSLAVPAGFGGDGMPLSVQLIGPPGEEGRLFSVGAQLEAERRWVEDRPPIS